MRHKLGTIAFCITVAAPLHAGRTEFIVKHEGQTVAGASVCFIKAAASGASPQEFWFHRNDVHCLPANIPLELPIGRFHYFALAPGFISNGHNFFAKTEASHPDAFKQVIVPLVRSGTLDFRSTPLDPGQSIAALAISEQGTSAGLYLPIGADPSIEVPADVPVLPLVIENRAPIALGVTSTIPACATRTAQFSRNSSGVVVAWIDYDPFLLLEHAVFERLGKVRTALVTEQGTRHEPLFSLGARTASYAQLQIFRDIPEGGATISVEGDRVERAEVTVNVRAGKTVLTNEPLVLSPASTIEVKYRLSGAVGPNAAREQSCDDDASPSPAPPLRISAYACAGGHDAQKIDTADCVPVTVERPLSENVAATFERMRTGWYVIEAAHPVLGTVRKTVYALPARDLNVELEPPTFPLFGRVTRRSAGVRAVIGFGEGTRAAGTAVTAADGSYEVLLPADPRNNSVTVTSCDGKLRYTHRAAAPPMANAAFDIEVPLAEIAVTVRDATTRRPLSDAIVNLKMPDVPGVTLRETSEANGLAHFPAVLTGKNLNICARAPAQGYVDARCAPTVMLKDDERRNIEILLDKSGAVRIRVVSDRPMTPVIVHLVNNGRTRTQVTIQSDSSWLSSAPETGDYFVVFAPRGPLAVITSWSAEEIDGERIVVLAFPRNRIRSIVVRATGTDIEGRLVSLSVAGRRVPTNSLDFHLGQHGIQMTQPWKNGLVLPQIIESGPLAVSLGPTLSEFALGATGTDVFTRPDHAPMLQTQAVPADRDEVVFP